MDMSSEERQREEITKRLPSIKCSKLLLKKLCRIVDQVYSEITTQKVYNSLDLVYAYKNGISSTYHNTMSFLENLSNRGLNAVSIHLYSRVRQIRIEISVKDSWYYVNGTEPTWVRGTSEQLFEIFGDYILGFNTFINSRKVGITWNIIGIILILFISYFIPKFTHQQIISYLVVAVIGTWGYWICVWLYPKFETDKIIQVKLRKVFVPLLGVVAALITIIGVIHF
jgi:hypothetical protein